MIQCFVDENAVEKRNFRESLKYIAIPPDEPRRGSCVISEYPLIFGISFLVRFVSVSAITVGLCCRICFSRVSPWARRDTGFPPILHCKIVILAGIFMNFFPIPLERVKCAGFGTELRFDDSEFCFTGALILAAFVRIEEFEKFNEFLLLWITFEILKALWLWESSSPVSSPHICYTFWL